MTRYKIISGGQHCRFEAGAPTRYAVGDEIDLSDAEVAGKSLRGRVELVGEAPATKAPHAHDDTIGDLLSLSFREAIAAVGSVDDLDLLGDLFDAECVGRDRKTVIAAISAKIDALTPEKDED